MGTAINESAYNRIVYRAVNLSRYEAHLKRKTVKFLKEMDKQLVKDLQDIDPSAPARMTYKQKRLVALQKQTTATINTAYAKINKETASELRELAIQEGRWTDSMLKGSIAKQVPAAVNAVLLNEVLLKRIVSDNLIDGAATSEWWRKQAGQIKDDFNRAVKAGIYRGEGTREIARKYRSAVSAGGLGLAEKNIRRAEILVRTSVNSTAAAARDEVYTQNSDLIAAIQWDSTLDARTTEICMVRDGLQYTVTDHEPIGHDVPWLDGPGNAHWGCRSVATPVVRDVEDLKKAARREKVYGEPGQKELSRITHDKKNYEQWLTEQPEWVQNKALGKGKANLFRKGELTFSDMVNQDGRPLRLKDLKDAS